MTLVSTDLLTRLRCAMIASAMDGCEGEFENGSCGVEVPDDPSQWCDKCLLARAERHISGEEPADVVSKKA